MMNPNLYHRGDNPQSEYNSLDVIRPDENIYNEINVNSQEAVA